VYTLGLNSDDDLDFLRTGGSSSDSMTNVLTYDRDWGNLGHRKPILLQHGHHMDSAIWFKEHNTGKPLPLQLFDAGYDVWLGNNRGSLNCGFTN